MNVLLTGGSGFVGRHLRRQLSSGSDVHAPTSSEMDVRDLDAVRRVFEAHKPTICIHLAAQGSQRVALEDPERTHAVNCRGAANVLEAAGSRCRVVLLSSCHVYGPPERLPVDEEHPTRGRGIYAESKMAAEAEAFARDDRDWVLVRAFNLTGPGQTDHFAASEWAHAWARGAREIQTGNLNLRRDYMDVRDACAGIELLSRRAPSRSVFNLCSGRSVLLSDLFALAAPGAKAIWDRERARSTDLPEIRGCSKRANALGWAPEISLEKSLSDLRERLSAPS